MLPCKSAQISHQGGRFHANLPQLATRRRFCTNLLNVMTSRHFRAYLPKLVSRVQSQTNVLKSGTRGRFHNNLPKLATTGCSRANVLNLLHTMIWQMQIMEQFAFV